MNLSPLSGVLLDHWYFLLLIIAALVVKGAWFKGHVGEAAVNFVLGRLPKDEYTLIKDVTVPAGEGTTQIDHVVVSKYGLFVIETKNYKGWIFGSERQAQWTQQIYKQRHKFQNPLRQNYKHLKVLQEALNLPIEQIHSVVVFVGESTFKTQMPDNVTSSATFLKYIHSFNKKIFTAAEVAELIQRINDLKLERGIKTGFQHRKFVRQIVNEKHVVNNPKIKSAISNQIRVSKNELLPQPEPVAEEIVEEKLCPKCGAMMIQRTAKRGSHIGERFWGCSNYPKCRSVMKIER